MTITWYGHSCFKIETRDATVAIDPFGKETGLTPPRFQADIVLITHDHPAHANADSIAGDPAIVRGPGEYEIKGVAIRGIPTFHDAADGLERGVNTVFRIDADGIAVAHLGDYGEKSVRDETLEALGDIDALLVPVGGPPHTVDGETAAKIVNHIEPKLVIPMHYAVAGSRVALADPQAFLKALGGRDAEKLPRLAVRAKDFESDTTRIVLLAAGGDR